MYKIHNIMVSGKVIFGAGEELYNVHFCNIYIEIFT